MESLGGRKSEWTELKDIKQYTIFSSTRHNVPSALNRHTNTSYHHTLCSVRTYIVRIACVLSPLCHVLGVPCCLSLVMRCSTRRRVPVRTRVAVNFDFGVSPVLAPPTMVHLMLYNDGDTPTEWYAMYPSVCEEREQSLTVSVCTYVCTCPSVCRAFQFPEDMYLEPEYWADKGELDEVEQHEVHS